MASKPDYLAVFTQLPVDLTTLLFKLVLYLLPPFRPVTAWSYAQAVRVYIFKIGAKHTALLDKKTALHLEPGKDKERFVVVKPASDDKYVGPANHEVIRPSPVGLTWSPAAPQPGTTSSQSSFVLHFHGGAYATGTGRGIDTGFAAKMFRRHLGCSFVCSPQYRLATNEKGYFPAALQDALTAYTHLVIDWKIPAAQIVFSGDSAGANLALALLRYLDEHASDHHLPLPAAATLWSPWVDVDDALRSRVESKRNFATDYLTTPFVRWGASLFTNNGTIDASQPYISPLHHPFPLRNGTVPLFVQTGDREILYYDNVQLAERLEEAGWKVRLLVVPGCPHDIMMFGKVMGFEKAAAKAATEARKFLAESTMLQLGRT